MQPAGQAAPATTMADRREWFRITARESCTHVSEPRPGGHRRCPRIRPPRRPEEVGRRDRRAHRARPRGLVRRLAGGVRPPVRRDGRIRHADQAEPGKAQELLPRLVRPLRRRPRRGPHLHLLAGQGGRRPDQQLGSPGSDARDPERPVQGVHARPHHVRDPVLDGSARQPDRPHRRRDLRQPLRRHQHAHHDPHGPRCGRGARHRPRVRALRAHRGRPARPGREGQPLAVQPDHQVHRALPRDARDLVLRLGLRRQRPARQEVLRAAHRLHHGA